MESGYRNGKFESNVSLVINNAYVQRALEGLLSRYTYKKSCV